jgi:GxxExxY protein
MERDSLTYAVIGCAMRVHRKLGPGFQEKIYQNALAIELGKLKLKYQTELSKPVLYDGQLIGGRRVDFVVESILILELKAVASLKDEHLVQTKNYTVIFGFPRALLLNFGATSLEYKLVFNPYTTSKQA